MFYSIKDPIDDFALVIASWSVKEVVYGLNEHPTRHLIGYVLQESEGRVTSDIKSFDRKQMIITTRSGRCYQLYKQPDQNDDADYVWKHWKEINNVRNERDVTVEYRDFET